MTDHADLRPHEVAVDLPEPGDAQLRFIGRVRTPWTRREDCPRQGDLDGPLCRLELFEPWPQALAGLDAYATVDVLYWLDRSRRDLVVQNPGRTEQTFGTFALRSPVRPNPIGLARARLHGVAGGVVTVSGLDCLDGTPLIDLKPNRCAFTPKAPPKP